MQADVKNLKTHNHAMNVRLSSMENRMSLVELLLRLIADHTESGTNKRRGLLRQFQPTKRSAIIVNERASAPGKHGDLLRQRDPHRAHRQQTQALVDATPAPL